jgi:hypothetical protein
VRNRAGQNVPVGALIPPLRKVPCAAIPCPRLSIYEHRS